MRSLIAIGPVLLALILAPPSLALSTQPVPRPVAATQSQGADMPLALAPSPTVPPPGFSSDAEQAVAAAEAAPTVRGLHAREHPLFVVPQLWSGRRWVVDFSYRGKLVAEADVSPAGRVTAVWTGPLAIAPYAHGHYAPLFASVWVLVPFSLVFLLPFLDRRRLRRMLHLDGIVLLSFLASFYLFEHARLQAAVWLAYPPLIYLLVRMLVLGARGGGRGSEMFPLLCTRALGVGLLAIVGARVGLSLANDAVIDVGYSSVIGAHRIVHGQSLYYASAAHGDTYGPVAYLAYVPFELLSPWRGIWDYLPSAHVASLVFDLVTISGLVVLGRRMRPGPEGRRLGLALGWTWAACPLTLLGLIMHSNDGLLAMLSVLSLIVFSSPPARGAVLGLAAAAKFSPAALLPLFANDRERGWKGSALCLGAFALVAVGSIALYLPAGGVGEFYDHTIGYQLHRDDVFSAWALNPGLGPLRTALEVAALLLGALVAFLPRRRTLTQVCALAAAVTIAVQLPALHWFYYYVIWFMPFALLALLASASVVPREAAPPPHFEARDERFTHVPADRVLVRT